jgi:putative transposase
LFKTQIDKQLIDQITELTLKGWVLGNDRFKQQIESQTKRRVEPQSRGGDRKSRVYHEIKRNQLL